MKELNNRQIRLYDYLLKKYDEDRYISKSEICRDLPMEYPRHLEYHNNEGNKSSAYASISKDIRELNENDDITHIIVSSRKGFKIANYEETIAYILRKHKSALRLLVDSNKLKKKLVKDNQMYFDNEEIKEVETFIKEAI